VKAPWRTIVGVVRDEPQDSLGRAARPEIYESVDQNAQSGLSVAVRSTVDSASLVPAVRAIVRSLDAAVVVQDLRPLDVVIADSLRAERFSTWLVTLCGASALLLALIGVYGVVSYAVAQRVRELGVRLALGATRRNVFGLVARRTLWPVAAGLVAGLALALASSRVLATQLFAVSPWDPLVFVSATLLLLAAALAAGFVPARRATRIDPLQALRSE
jgi:ABC-type antimicrobial peptide transport system permease subunit